MHGDAIEGAWEIAEDDAVGLRNYGHVSMRFDGAGKLIYTIHEADRDQIIIMAYKIDGDVLITDQPSAPKIERTRFRLDGSRCLILEYGEDPSQYMRLNRTADPD